MNTENLKIAVLGAGNIGAAFARGLARRSTGVGVYNRSEARLEQFRSDSSFRMLTTDLCEAVEGADIVVICVEGDAVEGLIKAMGKSLKKFKPLIVSCAAAPTLGDLKSWIEPFISSPRIMRLLPNIAATYGCSVNLIASEGIDATLENALISLFSATGKSYPVPERLFRAAMAISSCGIANVLRFVRATTEAGVELGLSPQLAASLAAGSLEGASEMLYRSNENPEALVDKVTTPGGITIRGLNAMEAKGFSAAVIAGVKEAGGE